MPARKAGPRTTAMPTRHDEDIPRNTVESLASHDRRLTRVETEIEAQSLNIFNLTKAVDENGRQISQLALAVNTAMGPRKTDWHLVLGAIGLIAVLGAAAFSPMFTQIGDSKLAISALNKDLSDHQKLTMHPVGAARIDAMEVRLQTHLQEDRVTLEELDAKLRKQTEMTAETLKERTVGQQQQLADLNARMQHEIQASQDAVKEATASFQTQIDRRFLRLENVQNEDIKRDLDELQQRRMRDGILSQKHDE